MKRIHILRHAKSSWSDSSINDHDRPLSARGRKAAARIAAYIDRNGIRPQLVLSSTAQRARETVEGISGALDSDTSMQFQHDLYLASVGELVECLKAIDESVSSAMLVGHNPALGELVVTLASDGPDLGRVRTKFPTAALATLSFEGKWRDLTAGTARLVDYVVPKDLK